MPTATRTQPVQPKPIFCRGRRVKSRGIKLSTRTQAFAPRTSGRIVNLKSDTRAYVNLAVASSGRALPRAEILIAAVYIHLLTPSAKLSRARSDSARTTCALKYSLVSDDDDDADNDVALLPRHMIPDKSVPPLVPRYDLVSPTHVQFYCALDHRKISYFSPRAYFSPMRNMS